MVSRTENQKYGTYVSSQEIRFERILPGPIETVWEYLTDSEKRGTWLATGPMELKVGGKVQLHFLHSSLSEDKIYPEKFKQMENGVTGEETIVAYDPPRFLSMTWGADSEVSFELVEKGEDVLLTLKHYKLVNDGEKLLVSAGWHSHLDILVSKMFKEPVPLFWKNFLKYESDYERLREESKV
ncbi:SRPBCC family protein [Leptospira semungkisensis]|uniref:SRPBCC family protein n=1 Tax=Leptospira semungkisensis TaxID=2484985 RepID=A0A4R9FLV8_9LEPT|nr:SRPBCC family protein [Leptospira semungkisensis]TGJ99322.1 SRPBCC family protein [Leptospira semungkisensis]